MQAKQNEFYVLGRDSGNNAVLEVAIELSHLQLELMK
jgi:hypothetical protein